MLRFGSRAMTTRPGRIVKESSSTPAFASRTDSPLIAFDEVSKRFNHLWANRDVSFEVMKGSVHAVVGENGAGKSTLMKILYGHQRATSGRIYLRGVPVDFRHPREALRAGIGMVHQQLLIFPQLTALDNIVLGAVPSRWGWMDLAEARLKVERFCDSFGFELPLEKTAGEISFAHRQQIEILRALYRGAEILILDEPTSLLAPQEVSHLLDLLHSLRASGHTILFISHRLAEVFAVSERITVLRRGKAVRTCLASQTTVEAMIQLIMGKDPDVRADSSKEKTPSQSVRQHPLSPPPETTALLDLSNVTGGRSAHVMGIQDLSLRVHEGEILGLGSVVGNGERTLARIIAGVQPHPQGRIVLRGRDIHPLSVGERASLGLRWLPANPLEEHLLPTRPLWENCLLGRQRIRSFQNRGWLLREKILRWARDLLHSSSVVYSSITDPPIALSGGNQQRISTGRVLEGSPTLALLEQPTRGLDIQARERLYERILGMCARGVAFVLFSYDLDELMALSHRIGILYRGRLMGIVDTGEATREMLGRWMLGMELNSQGLDASSRSGGTLD